ncbi:hypothetical protein N7532_005383 [Penicillium argentinense]|uniref:Asparaginase n=1 Tax=Penicillium argentinense TaxID=1131581 RepID=A0A9W9FDV3_9EURO|nr:uncharacterized protein N7532_005383 [Penicillium argentinense]KAJ5098382.1 hypothetical protein N7532_005383 [Penicillium argentinense]
MGDAGQSDGLCAIFVHVGAGFHSLENSEQHLLSCKHAVRAGMVFLRNGGSAVDAVEIAISALEDDPITNSGYGSNLNEKGVVEGDATIVDHFGRSGAAGAVPHVKNPIMLARKIYDKASKNPGCGRIPPNFLAGKGAEDFAFENGLITMTNDEMVSPAARSRWISWKEQIKAKESVARKERPDDFLRQVQDPMKVRISQSFQAPDMQTKVEGELETMRQNIDAAHDEMSIDRDALKYQPLHPLDFESFSEGSGLGDGQGFGDDGGDAITDTVGAIAVDRYGNIAAGSSSGGIGMKHRGRIGPAALIGIGTHVIPVDPEDPDETAVAAVTSGTGEHIASSFAASTSAARVYHCQKMNGNSHSEQVTEEEALSAMITNEFIGHPAVRHSSLGGDIGIMAVKRTTDGIALYFAHNAKSFALGSMSSNDKLPSAVMSRVPDKGKGLGRHPVRIAQGGLMFRPVNRTPAPRTNPLQNEEQTPEPKRKERLHYFETLNF